MTTLTMGLKESLKKTSKLLAITGIFALTSCADVTNTPGVSSSGNDSYSYVAVDEDPLELINRPLFTVHGGLDTVLFKPAAQAYNYAVPETGQTIVSNILENLATPITFANSLLQGDIENSFASFWRFAINSTIGIGGANDLAAEAGLTMRTTDFGQTLATYGIGSGAYLFIPVIGPTTFRDGLGRGADTFFRPLTWAEGNTLNFVESGANGLNFRAQNLKLFDDIGNSIDPYATFRSIYLQRRAAEIREAVESRKW